jgi:PAS domain S-box-containing protein
MKILIVDDNNDDRNMLCCVLQAHGHDVMEAINGEEGLQTTSAQRLDLIISDVLMPVMDGFQFLRTLRKSSAVPFVFYSAAYDGSGDMQLAASLGADGYLLKPKDPVELIEEIGRIAGQGPRKNSGAVEEDDQFLKRYCQVVASKLEEKVRELEETLAERKQAEEEYRLILKTTMDGFAITDKEGKFLDLNDSYCRIIGYDREELMQMKISDIEVIKSFTEIKNHLERIEKQGWDRFETRHRRKDGTIIDCEVSINSTLENGGRFVSFLRDISGRKRAEQELLDRQQRLSAMAIELSLAEEQERRRIAAELHDNIGQTLLLGKIKLGSLISELPRTIDGNELTEILSLQDTVIRSVRSLTQQLSPPILSMSGLEAALEWLNKQMEEDYGLRVSFVNDRRPKPLSEDMRIIVFQACRELFINVVKHAETASAQVAIGRKENRFYLTVEDHGVGFDCAGFADGGSWESGFGLFNIRERIKRLGGEVIFESAPGRGTRVTLWLTLQAE